MFKCLMSLVIAKTLKLNTECPTSRNMIDVDFYVTVQLLPLGEHMKLPLLLQ